MPDEKATLDVLANKYVPYPKFQHVHHNRLSDAKAIMHVGDEGRAGLADAVLGVQQLVQLLRHIRGPQNTFRVRPSLPFPVAEDVAQVDAMSSMWTTTKITPKARSSPQPTTLSLRSRFSGCGRCRSPCPNSVHHCHVHAQNHLVV